MAETNSAAPPSIRQLVLIPAVITLAVTVLRLTGELLHWSKVYFDLPPGGGNALIGITWLPPVFGIYFAVRLFRAGRGPSSWWRAFGFALLGVAVVVGGAYLPRYLHHEFTFRERLLYGWANMALAALVTFPGWAALFRALLAYGYAARIPVVIVMFFAFARNWGTHYDSAPDDLPVMMSLVPKWLWLGFFPQLILWVGFTIASGMLFGVIAAGLFRLFRPAPKTA